MDGGSSLGAGVATLSERGESTWLPRDRRCAMLGRTFAEKSLRGRVSQRALEDVELVVSELVDNAYRHGRGQIALAVRWLGDRVRVEVVDEGEKASLIVRQHEHDSAGGYGLWIVDTLAQAWGAYEGATHIWADLRAD
jgi:anti-sigma regulatory factor (Ser/Thr protein kinase)